MQGELGPAAEVDPALRHGAAALGDLEEGEGFKLFRAERADFLISCQKGFYYLC